MTGDSLWRERPWVVDPGPGWPESPTFTRLEPLCRSGNPAAALSAAVADPLWLLLRQWQFGEFAGEDAGTPVSVQVETASSAAYALRPTGGAVPLATDDGVSMDAAVEREAGPPLDYLTRARFGFALIKGLRAAGLGAVADGLPRLAPLAGPPPGAPARAVAPLLSSRCADAERLFEEVQNTPSGVPLLWGVKPAQVPAFQNVVRPWMDTYAAARPDAAVSAWSGPRLEYDYQFDVDDAARTTTLTAIEATSGRGEWWSFDATSRPLAVVDPFEDLTTHTSAATPLRYPGMPADRFWEFEDAKVNLGALEVQPHDLARLLVAECALIFGCDWLNIPIDARASSLVTVRNVQYRTTFGETITVPASPISNESNPWRMFVVSTGGGAIDGLITPPSSSTRLEGPPIEEVVFLRDESANLAWAVERIVPDGLGRGMPRETARIDAAAATDQAPGTELRYLLATSVPSWWVPYLPRLVRTSQPGAAPDRVALHLVQGALTCDASSATEIWGQLLAEDQHNVIFDAEVPREGVRVQRVPMLARRPDGAYVSWTARRVGVGRGEGHSGLAFDSAIPHA